MHTGGCECGSVRFEVLNLRKTVTQCHCSQCRRMSGHVWASTNAKHEDFKLIKDEGLTWFASSEFAERGFCAKCGSSLFYRLHNEDHISVAAGCLDDTSDLSMGKHIFVKDKGAYYEIADTEQQIERF